MYICCILNAAECGITAVLCKNILVDIKHGKCNKEYCVITAINGIILTNVAM
jgi:hypothetical protein